jgi:hypothetical protein
MKRILPMIAVMIAFPARVLADDYIGRVPCNAANVDGLRNADHAAVVRFVNATRPQASAEIPSPNVVGEFGWANVGGGKSDFVVLLDFSERGFFNRLWIYHCGSAGDLNIQEIEGWEMGGFNKMVRDFNGDGKDELIIRTQLSSDWRPTSEMPAWPAVYRLENGEYVEASRDFPNYYDEKVLPELDKGILEAEARIPREPFQQETVAVLEMERNKILRVLGRDPAAGLNQAYQWMNSDDPQLMQCAIATFADIGGHEKEARELQQALPDAIKRKIESRGGG